ncbi:INT5 protein, partial [Heliornis fulica]|nr:INT5 protein [Heliornis fulica]
GTKLSSKDHARCALLLLRTLPPARHAALDHFRSVFDEQVSFHLLERESLPPSTSSSSSSTTTILNQRPGNGGLSDVIREIRWGLMGQLSSKYAGCHGLPAAGGGLNELLQLWMTCEATKTLMEIYIQCLSAMIGACPDSCVDALLDTSIQHSPHLDWVVAHIGSSFPNTIINRVLSCGLKDFGGRGTAGEGLFFPVGSDKRGSKIASVVGILGHLVARHSGSIKQEFLRMFHESLGPARDQHHKAAIPFLLHVAAMSPPLLAAVSSDLIDSLNPGVLNQLHQCFSALPREDLENMMAMVVHLISQTSSGAFRVLQFLIDTAMPASVITPPGVALQDGVRESCDRIIQLLLLNLQKLVYNRPAPVLTDPVLPLPRPIPFLDALRSHLWDLCVETLRMERKRFLWHHQLLGLLAVYSSPHCAADSLFFLLSLAATPEELTLAAQLYAVLASCLPDLLPATVQTCVCQIQAGKLPEAQISRLLRNLAAILQWEGGEGETAAMAERLGKVLERHLRDVGQLLLHRDAEVGEAACLLLSVCPFPASFPPAQLSAVVRAAVHQFFHVLRSQNSSNVASGSKLLARLSGVSPAAAKSVLQQLVEGALRGRNAELFGGEGDHPNGGGGDATNQDGDGMDTSLLDVNRRFTAAVNFSGGVWSVFHAGVIGKGLKAAAEAEERPPEELANNTQTFLTLLIRCSRIGPSPSDTEINPEAAKAVAAALVESVCPEASGGELIWPPEEQSRATIERDLRICRCFRRQPLLFPLLRLVASGRPALCSCSVLLRGLLAALMSFWEGCRDPGTTGSPWHLQASCHLLVCLTEGSLVPPVLGNVQELFQHLAPFEVHLLLLSVWEYLRENHPLPQKFTFQAQRGVFLRDFHRDGDVGKHLGVLHSVLH